jgi:nicotinic acetylcholine receptor
MYAQWFIFITLAGVPLVYAGNPDAKRLYDDLLSNYNKLVRPVVNTSDILKVRIKLRLSQLIDVVSMYTYMCVNIKINLLAT